MAKYVVTAPDGRRFSITGNGSQEEALAHFQSQYAPKPTAAQPENDPSQAENTAPGIVEKVSDTLGYKTAANLGHLAQRSGAGVVGAFAKGAELTADAAEQTAFEGREAALAKMYQHAQANPEEFRKSFRGDPARAEKIIADSASYKPAEFEPSRVVKSLAAAGDKTKEWEKQAVDALDPQWRSGMELSLVQRDADNNIVSGGGIKNPYWWAANAIDMGAQMIPGIGVAGVAAKFAYAGKYATALEALTAKSIPQSVAILTAKKEATKAAVRAATIAGGLSEGTIAGGGDAAQVQDTLEQVDEPTLMNYAPYRELRDKGMSHEVARARVAKDQAMAAGLASAIVVGLTGAPLNSYIARWMSKAGKATSRLGVAAESVGLESGQEFIQEGSERAIQNKAEQPITGKDTWEDVLENAITGATLGAVLGGAGGALAGPNTGKAKPAPGAKPTETPPTVPSPATAAYEQAKDAYRAAQESANDPTVKTTKADLDAAREAYQTATVGLAHERLISGQIDAKAQPEIAKAIEAARAAGIEVPETGTKGQLQEDGALNEHETQQFDRLSKVATADALEGEELRSMAAEGLVTFSNDGHPLLTKDGRKLHKSLEKRVAAEEAEGTDEAQKKAEPKKPVVTKKSVAAKPVGKVSSGAAKTSANDKASEAPETGVAALQTGDNEWTVYQDRKPLQVYSGKNAKAQANDDVEVIKTHVGEVAGQKVEVNVQPTEAQKSAGNYKKGHIQLHGLDIAIENPRGTQRSGTDANGKTWNQEMHADYGYVKGAKSKDGDNVDMFIGPSHDREMVYVIDQLNEKSKFDEHKVITGVKNARQAKQLYMTHYPQGWKGLGALTPMSVESFKGWLDSGKTKEPVAFGKTATTTFSVASNVMTNVSVTPKEITVSTAGGKMRAEVQTERGQLQAREAEVTQAFRGQKHGVAMAERLVKEASKRGLTFVSDTRVSDNAARVYEALERRGYTVKRNPANIDRGTGELTSKSELKPVFEITDGPTATNREVKQAAKAGPPRASQDNAVSETKAPVAASVKQPGPIFFSRLAQAASQAKLKKGSAEQWLNTLKNMPGVKAEEIEWTGLEEWLNELDHPATQEEVKDFLNTNSIKVDETVLGQAEPNLDSEYALPEVMKALRRANGSMEDLALALMHDGDAYRAMTRTFPQFMEDFESEHADVNWAEYVVEDIYGNTQGLNPKFSEYTLPGGKKYKELLLTLPANSEKREAAIAAANEAQKKYHAAIKADLPEAELDAIQAERDRLVKAVQVAPKFASSHWNQSNVLAHVRFDERQDVEGKRVLHIAEVQSDWHQKGRREGYRKENPTPEDAKKFFGIKDDDWAVMSAERQNSYVEEMKSGAAHVRGGSVPDAPFKTTWPELAMKRMIRWASENGFDRITWDTGATNADRYDLSKELTRVRAYRDSEETDIYHVWAFDKNDSMVLDEMYAAEKLPDVVGKDLADKIVQQQGDMPVDYTGLDLKVGGEGMTGFYDKMLPKAVDKYVKKWGTKVISDMVDAGSKAARAHALDITPEMRLAAMGGQPLFRRAAETNEGIDLDTANEVAEQIKAELGHEVQVAASIENLPRHIRNLTYGLPVNGIFHEDPAGGTEMWLVNENLSSREDAYTTAIHELVGHLGTRAVLGKDYAKTMRRIRLAFPRQIIEVAARNKIPLNHADKATRERFRNLAAEELVAYATERVLGQNAIKQQRTVWHRIVDMVRAALRSVGLLKKFSAGDIDNLILRARDHVQKNRQRDQVGQWKYEANVNRAAQAASILSKKTGNAHLDSFFDKIGGKKPSLKQRYKQFTDRLADRLIQGGLDDFHGFKRADDLAGISSADSMYKSARLSRNSAELTQAMMEYGSPIWDGGAPNITGGRGFLDIIKPLGGNLNNWLAYMVAKRASRLMSEGRENLFTKDEINAAIALGKQHPEFDVVAAEYAAFQGKVLDFAQTAGIIDPNTRALWENADYIPFYRLIENGEVKQTASAGSIGKVRNQIKKLKGGDANLGDPLENIVRNWLALTDASLKANAAREAVDQLNGTGLVTKAPQVEPTSALVPREQIKLFIKNNQQLVQTLQAVGLDVNKLPASAFAGLQKMYAVQAPTAEDVITVWRNGKREYWKVHDSLLLQSFLKINAKAWGPLMEIFRYPKRLLTAMVTSTPSFAVRNLWRDMWQAFVQGSAPGMKKTIMPGLDTVKGTISQLRMDQSAQSMLAGGGSFTHGYIRAGDTEGAASTLRRSLKKRSTTGKVLNSVPQLIRFYRDVLNASENAHRVAVYNRALASGKTRKEALYDARDMLDFSMRGNNAVVQFLVESVPFLNARLQGLYRLGRGFKEDYAGVAIRGLLITMAALALFAANHDDERYKELTDEQKDGYWHFFDVFEKGDHWKLPKPFEVGAIFATIPEAIMEAFVSAEPDAASQSLKLVRHSFANQLNLSPRIQAVWPLLELAINKNTFTGAPILTQGDQNVLPEDQDSPSVSPTYRAIAQSMPEVAPDALRSPKQLQHLGRGYLGNLQDYVLLATDEVVRRARGEAKPPARAAEDWPFLRDFRTTGPSRHTRYNDIMFELAGEADKVYASVNRARKAGTDQGEDRAEQLETDKESLLNVRKDFTKAADKVIDLRKAQRAIQLDNTMDPEQKRTEIRDLQQDINDTAQSVFDLRPGGKLNSDTVVQLVTSDKVTQVKLLKEKGLTVTAEAVRQMNR